MPSCIPPQTHVEENIPRRFPCSVGGRNLRAFPGGSRCAPIAPFSGNRFSVPICADRFRRLISHTISLFPGVFSRICSYILNTCSLYGARLRGFASPWLEACIETLWLLLFICVARRRWFCRTTKREKTKRQIRQLIKPLDQETSQASGNPANTTYQSAATE